MNNRPQGACCGNCGAWLKFETGQPVEVRKNQFGPVVTWPGECHMLPNPVNSLANHFCFMWIEKEKESK